MALSATVDAKARVTLTTSTPGSSFVWKKDGVTLATTATGSVKDQRPNKNYVHVPAQSCTEAGGAFVDVYNAEHRSMGGNARKTTTVGASVSFTFTGVEFGVCLDKTLTSYVADPSAFAEAQIDGGAWESFELDIVAAGATHSQILWGKAGLANVAHTVTVRLKADPNSFGMTFDGYFYSNRSTTLGVPVAYSVTIDGGATETVTVTPTVNRRTVLESWADRAIALAPTWTFSSAIFEYNEWVGGVALLYYLTKREGLRGVADTLYNAYISAADANGLTSYDVQGKRIVVNGRTAYNYWLAYKVFGDPKFLTAADRVGTAFRNLWPRSSPVSPNTGATFPGIWADTFEGAAPASTGNMWSAPCYGLAMLYNEPASVHYHDATVLTRIQQNLAWAVDASWDPVKHRWVYSRSTNRFQPPRVYGEFQQEHMDYLATSLGLYVTETNGGAAWVTNFGTSEPFWWTDAHYDTTPTTGSALSSVASYLRAGATVPADVVDRMYSAAFAGPSTKYDPRGVDDAVYDGRTVCWDAIRSTLPLYVAGVDPAIWAFAPAVEVPMSSGADLALRSGVPLVETMLVTSNFPRPQFDAVEVWDGTRYLAGRLTLLQ